MTAFETESQLGQPPRKKCIFVKKKVDAYVGGDRVWGL